MKIMNPRLWHAPAFWEKRGVCAWLLSPLSWVYGLAQEIRNTLYEIGLLPSRTSPVPVIFVGNIRVGGTGKTPTVLALAKALAASGFQPGIISRGYGAQIDTPRAVSTDSRADEVGDEPYLLASALKDLEIPVWVSRHRVASIMALLQANPKVNVIISDDGLQHATLKRWPAREGGRDIELVLRDDRGEGNRMLLPAGPLREHIERARDFTISTNSDTGPLFMSGSPHIVSSTIVGRCYQLNHPEVTADLADFKERSVTAAAGLGNPQKFFGLLAKLDLHIERLPLPDHYDFKVNPLTQVRSDVILITEKDAVKCRLFESYLQDTRIWVVPVEIKLPQEFIDMLVDILNRPTPQL